MGTYGNAELGKQLLDLKNKLEKEKEERTELQGRLKSALDQLKDLGVSSIKEGEKRIIRLEEELEQLKTDIEKGIADIYKLMGE